MVEINFFKTDVINHFSDSIRAILDDGNKTFLNEGTISFELSKNLTRIEKNKENIRQEWPNRIDLNIIADQIKKKDYKI